MKALIFDLDETLINRQETMRRFLAKQCRRLSRVLNSSEDDIVSSVLRHQRNGYESKLTAYELACQELLEDSSSAKELFQDFKENYGFDAVLFDGVKEILEKLSKNFSLAIVTNGRSRCQNAKIDSVEIRHLFQVIKISEEFGAKKPDPIIFEACLSDLDCEAESAICIGDNPDNDLQPAKKLGMKTIWVRNPHFQAPDGIGGIIDSVASIQPAISEIVQGS